MLSTTGTPNFRQAIAGVSTITSDTEFISSTNKRLNVNATATIAGSAIPVTGATTAIVTAIVDGSGNQVTSFGGGAQYTDGGVPPAHPSGGTIEWSDGSNWQTVSTAKPLPVSFTPSGTQDTNLKQINGNTTFTGNGVTGTGSQRVTIASDNTAFSVNATLSAETMKVIGTVNQGTSPWVISGTVTSNPGTLPSAEVNGQTTGTTAGTAVQLGSNVLTNGVIVQALSTNTTSVYVGTSSVSSSNGFELQPGQATSVAVSNTNAVWIVSTTNGDKICWIGS